MIFAMSATLAWRQRRPYRPTARKIPSLRGKESAVYSSAAWVSVGAHPKPSKRIAYATSGVPVRSRASDNKRKRFRRWSSIWPRGVQVTCRLAAPACPGWWRVSLEPPHSYVVSTQRLMSLSDTGRQLTKRGALAPTRWVERKRVSRRYGDCMNADRTSS